MKTSWKRLRRTSRFERVLSKPQYDRWVPQSIVTSGFCAERHSAQATQFRIQKPNSSERSFAFVVHPRVIGLFADCVQSEFVESPSQAVLFTSEGGFDDVDLLFTIAPPDFLTFICPDVSSDEKHFESIVARVDRWMQHRFITTVMVSQQGRRKRVTNVCPTDG